MTEAAMNWNGRPEALKPFPESLKRLIWLLQGREALTAGIVRRSIRAANIRLDELMPWVELAHAPWRSYAESCLYDSRTLEIIVRAWAAGDFSAIHASPDLALEFVQCFGAMKFYTYTMRGNVLRARGESHLGSGAILHLECGEIAQMGNIASLPTVSLHVRYRGHAPKTIKEPTRIFNLFAGEIQRGGSGAHFNIFAARSSVPSPERLDSDLKTSRRYYWQLRDRLQRILNSASFNVETVRENLSIVEERIAQL